MIARYSHNDTPDHSGNNEKKLSDDAFICTPQERLMHPSALATGPSGSYLTFHPEAGRLTMPSTNQIERNRGTKDYRQQLAVLRQKWALAFPANHHDIRPLAVGAAGRLDVRASGQAGGAVLAPDLRRVIGERVGCGDVLRCGGEFGRGSTLDMMLGMLPSPAANGALASLGHDVRNSGLVDRIRTLCRFSLTSTDQTGASRMVGSRS
jgi:hypothetical protein